VQSALVGLRDRLAVIAWDKAAIAAAMKETLASHQLKMPQLAPALRVLDTFFAHEALLPRVLRVPEEAVGFVHSLEHARAALEDGSARMALLLRPTSVRQIVDVSEAALSMPPKSTFFFPKLPSGLVIHPLPE
jgi:hypothetical protein